MSGVVVDESPPPLVAACFLYFSLIRSYSSAALRAAAVASLRDNNLSPPVVMPLEPEPLVLASAFLFRIEATRSLPPPLAAVAPLPPDACFFLPADLSVALGDSSSSSSCVCGRPFLHSTHLHASVHGRPAWKHSQYLTRERPKANQTT